MKMKPINALDIPALAAQDVRDITRLAKSLDLYKDGSQFSDIDYYLCGRAGRPRSVTT